MDLILSDYNNKWLLAAKTSHTTTALMGKTLTTTRAAATPGLNSARGCCGSRCALFAC